MFKLKFRNPILHVNVTARDWKEARKRTESGEHNFDSCPNALACNRALRRKFRRHPSLRAEVVGSFDMYDDDAFIGSVKLPVIASRIVKAFDSTRKHEPLLATFDLDLRKAK